MKKKLATEVENIRAEFDEKLRLVEDQKEELAKKFKDAESVTKTTQRQLEVIHDKIFAKIVLKGLLDLQLTVC